MAVITYLGTEYTVDHAVKGADFIHGYNADSVMIVAFDGITDFSGYTYDGTYMEPEHCLAEGCNDVKHVGGVLKRADGATVSLPATSVAAGTFAGQVVANSSGQTYNTSLLRNSKLVSADTNPTVNGEINWTYE